MRKLFFHIGAGKTGTSALQVAFARYKRDLRGHGVIYPRSRSDQAAVEGKITSGNGLELAVYLNPALKINVGRRDPIAYFKQLLRRAGNRDILYSSEFLRSYDLSRMKKMIEIADAEGFTTKLVFYVRSISGHAYSAYIQSIKRQRYTGSFQSFLSTYHNNFAETIEKAENTVKRENLIVRNYDCVRNSLLGDFMANVLGIPGEFAEVGKINRSLTFREVEFLREMNERFKDKYQSARLSDAFIYADPDVRTGVVMSAAEVSTLADRYDADLKRINQYIKGEGIGIVDARIETGTRQIVEWTEIERRLISILADFIPLRSAK